MKPDRSGAGRRDPREMRESMEISPDFDMDMESILDSAHEHQPAEKQVDADFFNGAKAGDASLLMLLVETNPAFWEAGGEAGEAASVRDAGFAAFFEQLVVFVQAFSLLNFQNKLVVVAVHGDGCHFLYDNVDAARADKDGGYEFAGTAGEIVARRMRELAASAPRGDPAPSPLSGALSQALCYIHRVSASGSRLSPRILSLHGSPDHPPQYISVMNAIFSAQADRVPVDACLLGPSDSPFLQQAANITGGICLRPQNPQGLVQYLLTVFACDLMTRAALKLPHAASVDFRASCFCHKRPVDMGYVCSVCLSIFCSAQPACLTCGTDFEALVR